MRVILYIDLATILVAALVSQFFIKGEGFDGFSVFVYSIATQIASEIVQEMIYKRLFLGNGAKYRHLQARRSV